MEILKGLRLKAGKFILHRNQSHIKRTKSFTNFTAARTMGIVWDASRPEEFRILSRFHETMDERHIEVKVLGYYPGENLPDQYRAVRYLKCMKKKDVDLLYRPVSEDAHNFMQYPFDILIDINFAKTFPLYFVTSMSVAGLKVGLFDSEANHSPFDMMLEMKENADIETYLKNVIVYLEMIKN
jgi:hypothetical protein